MELMVRFYGTAERVAKGGLSAAVGYLESGFFRSNESSRPGELHPQALTDSGLERLRSSGSYRPVNAGCNNGQ